MSLWRQTREKPQLLEDAPPLPAAAAHLWGSFCELAAQRGSNGMAASRITAQEMRDWCWESGQSLALWERRALRAIDNAWMRAQKHG